VFVQDNLSLSHKGVLRGMHYQIAPHAMGKLIRVLSGAIYDVLVDLRRGSPTFGKWMGREMTEDQPVWLYAPAGMAHGFLSLCDDTRVYYKCTCSYTPAAERAIRHNDRTLDINWPAQPALVSEKDAQAPSFEEADYNFVYERRP
jgi:dTDP-4-dehydrorhamnose 3,5-epimerase